VGLPTYSRRAGHHAEDEATPNQSDYDAEEDAAKAAGVPAGHHQIAEVAEDHTAGADVYRVRCAEQPRHEAGTQHSGDGHGNEVSLVAKHHHPAQRHEWDAVGDEVTEAAVKEGREQNPAEANHRARDDSERQKRTAKEQVHDEHRPEHAEGAAQHQGVGFQGSPYAGHAGCRR